jgi:hypothetical protein
MHLSPVERTNKPGKKGKRNVKCAALGDEGGQGAATENKRENRVSKKPTPIMQIAAATIASPSADRSSRTRTKEVVVELKDRKFVEHLEYMGHRARCLH